MEISSLSNFFQLMGGSAPVIFALGLLYVLCKTQSFHVLRVRVWRLIFGADEISDPVTKDFISQQSNLMAFRLFSGLPATSLEDAAELKAWSSLHGVSLQELSSISRFFDVPTRSIKLPNPRLYSLLNKLALLGCVAMVALCFSMTLEQRVNIGVKSTGHWYWMDRNHAVAHWWEVPDVSENVFSQSQCETSKKSPLANFELHDQEVLCDLWQQEASTHQLHNLQKAQRFLLIYFFFIFAFLMGWCIVRETQLRAVKVIESKISSTNG
jgi:hypothetical protein